MKNLTTLYKKDTKGKIRVICFYTENEALIEEYGLYGGKMIVNTKICKGKNIGKSNETTPEEQAKKELKSRVIARIDSGYFYNKKRAEESNIILPMLAKSYEDYKDKIDWNYGIYVQPKLDGMRCLAIVDDKSNVKLISRDGKEIKTVDFIKNQIQQFVNMCHIKNYVFDGELYAHGLTFQENMTLIKKYQKGKSEWISYHIYDTINLNKKFYNFELRFKFNLWIDLIDGSNFDNIKVTETIYIHDEESLIQEHEAFLSEGYEGTIVRKHNNPYNIGGRSSSLLKYKDFKDLACEIVDIEEGKQKSKWGVPRCRMPNSDKTFRTNCKLSHEERIEMLKNKDKYIGKTAEIRFFEYTDDGLPRFPVMVGTRLDK